MFQHTVLLNEAMISVQYISLERKNIYAFKIEVSDMQLQKRRSFVNTY